MVQKAIAVCCAYIWNQGKKRERRVLVVESEGMKESITSSGLMPERSLTPFLKMDYFMQWKRFEAIPTLVKKYGNPKTRRKLPRNPPVARIIALGCMTSGPERKTVLWR
jgi:hypothetical protein